MASGESVTVGLANTFFVGSGKKRLTELDINRMAKTRIKRNSKTNPIPENIKAMPSPINPAAVIVKTSTLNEEIKVIGNVVYSGSSDKTLL